MEKTKIVIIGAGIGGILLLKSLRDSVDADFTIIDDNDYFVFTPRLTEIFSESISKDYVVRPTRVFEDSNVNVVIDEAKNVDLEEEIVECGNTSIEYDFLVFSQGASTNTLGVNGVNECCNLFKDYQDVSSLKNEIVEKSIEQDSLNISLVGGGPTGTELGFAIDDLVRKDKILLDREDVNISIFESGDSLVGNMSEWFSNKAMSEAEKRGINVLTGKKVEEVSDDNILLSNGSKRDSDITVWVAGVKPNVIDTDPSLELESDGIPVRRTLQLEDYDNVLAIGDCNYLLNPEGEEYPKTAQIASEQAKTASENIKSLVKGDDDLEEFNYRIRGNLLALGNHNAVASVKSLFSFNGFIGWLARDLYYRWIFYKLTK